MLYSPTGKASTVTLAIPFSTVALYVVPFTVMLIVPVAVSLICTTITGVEFTSTITGSIVIAGTAFATVKDLDSVLFSLYMELPLYSAYTV